MINNINEEINKIIKEYKSKKIRITPVNSWRASELGHECLFYLFLNRTHWDKKQQIDIEKLLILEEGIIQEKKVIDDLKECGFNILEQQRSFYEKKYNITGHIDCLIQHKDLIPEPTLAEIKSLSNINFNSINSIDDLKKSKYYYIRNYKTQIMLYLFLIEQEEGLIILKNKVNGQLKFIPVKLDYQYVENILKKVEKLNKYLEEYEKDKNIIDKIEKCNDTSICKDCVFNYFCFKDKNWGNGLIVQDDINIEKLIEENKQLEEFVSLYEENDRIIKEYFKNFAEKNNIEKEQEILLNDKLIKINKIAKTIYKVPKDIQEQYKSINYYYIIKY